MKNFYAASVTVIVLSLAAFNGKAQWVQQTSGTTIKLNSVFFTDDNTGFAVGDSGKILKTTNGGTNWVTQTSGITEELISVYFVNTDTGYVVGLNSIALRTINAGANWTVQTSGATLYSVYFTDANTGYAVGPSGKIKKTINAGAAWTTLTSGTIKNLRSVYFTTVDTGFAVGDSGTILKTTNAGANWAIQTSGSANHLQSVYFTDLNIGYAVGAGGAIFKTTDGGTTWTAQTSGVPSTLSSVYFPALDTGYAVGATGKILKTTNGGTNWVIQTSGTTYWLQTVYSTDANTSYAVGGNGTILKYVCSPTSITSNPASLTKCEGQSASFTVTASGTTPYSYQWLKNGSTISGATSSSYSISVVTTADVANYSCYVSNACGNATSANAALTVNINPDATINAAGPFCTSSSAVNLTAATTGGTWSGTGITNSSTGTFNPATAGVGTHTITYSVTSGGCTGTDTEILVVDAPATASAGTDVTVCANNTQTLSGSIGGSATSLTWTTSGSGTFNNPVLSNATYTPSSGDIGNGSVILTIITNDPVGPCPASTDNMVLTISTAPIANAGVDDSICAGNTYTLSGTFGGSATSSTWTTSGSGTFNNPAILNAIYTPSGADISTGTITLTLTTNDPPGLCLAVNDNMALTINTNIISTVASSASASPSSVCSGSSATLSVTGGTLGTGASWNWYSGSCGGTFVGTGSSTSVSPSFTTIYYVRAEGTCNTTACVSATVTVMPKPNASISPSSVTICQGSSTTLTASGGGTYLWSTGATTASVTVTPSVTTNYTVTVTASGCDSVPTPVTVTVISNSTPTITPGGATTFCQGGSVTLTSSAANSYLWSNGATSQSINITTSGNYTVTVTYANGCTNSSSATTVTVNPNPDATINAAGPFCSSDAALNLTSVTSGGTWSGTGITNSSAGTFNPATAGVGTFTITYSVTTGGCTGTDTETITVNPSADATINPAGPFCVNDSPINLTAVQGGGLWSGIGIVNINTGTFDPSVVSGTTLVTYTISGSCSDTDTVLIVVNPQLDATITTSAGPYCTNDSPVPLTAVNGGGIFSGTGVTGNTFYPSSVPAGTYTITYIISGSCGDTGTINMQVQSCASSISGTIFNSDYSSQVTSGKVFLINYDTSAVQLSTADIFVLNGINGNYIFTNVSPGDYLIFVRPDTDNYPNTTPTYFGDTAYWYFASVLNLSSDTAGINIGVGEMAALAGNGFISGFIQYGIGTGKTGIGTVIPFGDPVPGIDVSLEQIPGGIKVHTNTDQNGIYSFSNLEMSSTYKLLVDIPGLPMDSSYTLTTSSSDSVFTGLDFVVDTTSGSAGIYVGYPLSAKELTVQNSGFRIYPNPNDGKFTLEITNNEITNNEIKIYNVFGKMVYKSSSITNPRFVIDFSNQPNGIYLVQVNAENNIYNHRLIKQ